MCHLVSLLLLLLSKLGLLLLFDLALELVGVAQFLLLLHLVLILKLLTARNITHVRLSRSNNVSELISKGRPATSLTHLRKKVTIAGGGRDLVHAVDVLRVALRGAVSVLCDRGCTRGARCGHHRLVLLAVGILDWSSWNTLLSGDVLVGIN